jgi:drug/metabolite transporter (DMT)-like permease
MASLRPASAGRRMGTPSHLKRPAIAVGPAYAQTIAEPEWRRDSHRCTADKRLAKRACVLDFRQLPGELDLPSTAVYYETIGSPPRKRRPISRSVWTCVGAAAIPLWATFPALAIRTFEIPSLEFLAMMFAVGWFASACLHRVSRASMAQRPWSWESWLPAVAFSIAQTAGDAAFMAATHRIPAAQANLLSYLWPVMIIVFGACIGLFRLRLRQAIGLGLGFSAAVILIWDGELSMSLGGIGLALLSGACWAAYCIFRLVWNRPSGDFLARGCALSAILCALLHLSSEATLIPSPGAFVAIVIAGIVPQALGNFVWDEGFRRGDSQLLAVLAYATPLCSVLLLAVIGAALVTWNLAIGAVVIVVAGILSRTNHP